MPVIREDIRDALPEIPCKQTPTLRRFPFPPTLVSDFEKLLEHDHPNHHTFELIPDWYNEKSHRYIRASQVPIDWKSKIGNSDMSTNFKVAKSTMIRKGDMAIREDGTIFILNWNVQDHPNNWATQSTECNARIEFNRLIPDKTDERGLLLEEAHYEVIAASIPCIHTEYAGRPDYATSQGTPGINADH